MSRIVRVPRVSTVASAALAIIIAAAVGPLVPLIATAGDLDPSFGIGGVASPPSGRATAASAIAVEAGGKIVAAAPEKDHVRITQFNPDGTIGEGFGAGGSVTP